MRSGVKGKLTGQSGPPSCLVNRVAAYHRADDLDVLDLAFVDGVEVVGQHDKVRERARGDRSFALLLARFVGVGVLTRSASSILIFWLAPQVSMNHHFCVSPLIRFAALAWDQRMLRGAQANSSLSQ